MIRSSQNGLLIVITMRLAGMLLPLLLAAGCGTFKTRTGNTQFGAYPYEGVAEDFTHMPDAINKNRPGKTIMEFTVLIVSIPFDLGLDTVLLPVDLACWSFGEHKDGFHLTW